MKDGWGRLAARAAVVLVVLAALAFFARGVQWSEAWRAVRGASPAVLALAAVVNLTSLVLKGVRWWVFLRPAGVTSLSLALRATFAGAAMNNILIANVGEPARALLVARSSAVPTERVLATLALERLFEFAGYVVMLALSVSLLPLPAELIGARPFAYGALVLLIGVMVYLMRHPTAMTQPPAAPANIVQRMAAYGRGFYMTLRQVSSGQRFTIAMTLSLAAWSLQVLTYQLTARAAHLPIPVVGTVAAILSVNIGFAVRATPGNVGVFQAAYALAAAAFGVDADAAIGVAILIQAQQILPVTLIGLVTAPTILSQHVRSTLSAEAEAEVVSGGR